MLFEADPCANKKISIITYGQNTTNPFHTQYVVANDATAQVCFPEHAHWPCVWL